MAENSDAERASRGIGRPFAQGVSGNPGGRPKGYCEIRRLAREFGPRAIARLAELMESPDGRVAATACIVLLDRGFGKPRTRDLTEERIEREIDKRITQLIAEAEAQHDSRPRVLGEGQRGWLGPNESPR
jgi:hypothetical protein